MTKETLIRLASLYESQNKDISKIERTLRLQYQVDKSGNVLNFESVE